MKSLVSLFAGKDEPAATPVVAAEKPATERNQRNEERRNGRQRRNRPADEERKPREERRACTA